MPCMKNYLHQTLGLSVLVLLMLTGLSLVPEAFPIGDFHLRKMDIFADIRSDALPALPEKELPAPDSSTYIPDTTTLAAVDSSQLLAPEPIPLMDSAGFGRMIEDYSFGQQGLSRLFEAVDSIRLGRSARIAWYGDSFVEGDILIGDLRDSLQTAWGGNGVGFVPITSEVARFKRTLTHDFSGWDVYSIVKKNGAHPPYGVNGFAYRPRPGARVRYDGLQYFSHTRQWSRTRLFYTDSVQNTVFYRLNGSPGELRQLPPSSGALRRLELNQPGVHTAEFQFNNPAGLVLYGTSLEDASGFYIDNFSVRGNSGGPLKLMRPEFMRQFDAYQQYDLVIIQVGLNAVTNSLNNIKWYEAELDRTFQHLRQCFPGKPVLVISVGDRAGKSGAELATMRGVPAIVSMQRDLARKHGFLFYDLFRGMGGPGSIIQLAHHKPMLANRDYTHLTHEGGRVIGYMLAKLFLDEHAKWKSAKPGM